MSSPLLALFVRSLREDARLKMTYVARVGLVVVVALVMASSSLTRGWKGAPGLEFFGWLADIQMIFITLAGLSTFASAITEEKEEGTLGLLRMTDLSPLSILLGKSTSRLCGALLLLAAQFPFTLLAVTLGGITVRQIVASYLALGAYTFFLCNFALLASVLARFTWHAVLMVGAVLALLSFAPTIFLGSGIGFVSTPARIEKVLASGFDGALLGGQFAINLCLGVLCLLLAWLLFDRCCDESGEAAAATGGGWLRREFPPGRVWPGDALVWKDAYFIHGGRGVAWLKFAAYGLAVVGVVGSEVVFGRSLGFSRLAETLLATSGLLLLATLAETGFAASCIFSVEVRNQTLSSLLLLPGSILDFHYAKGRACLYAVWPAACWTVVCLVSAGLLALPTNSDFVAIGAIFLFLGPLYLVPQVIAFFHFISWLSLKLPRGAFPLGVGIVFLGNFLVISSGVPVLGISAIAGPFFALIVASVFRDKVLARLDQLAADQ